MKKRLTIIVLCLALVIVFAFAVNAVDYCCPYWPDENHIWETGKVTSGSYLYDPDVAKEVYDSNGYLVGWNIYDKYRTYLETDYFCACGAHDPVTHSYDWDYVFKYFLPVGS